MLIRKTADKKFMVGFDLRDDLCQLSYYCTDPQSEAGREPVTFSTVAAGDQFNIPTALRKKTGANLWSCGQEAIRLSGSGEGTLLTQLVTGALDGRIVTVEDMDYDPCALLALFIKRCLAMLAVVVPTEQIAALMFTSPSMNGRMVEVLNEVKTRLELPVEDIYYEGHKNSFYQYMLMQPASLREREVLLFEYQIGQSLSCERLVFNHRTTPIVAYPEDSVYPVMATVDEENKDEEFLSIVTELLTDHEISSVFLIGDGFKGGWMKKSLAQLCYHRRVFQGNNLFSKGAAFSAYIKKEPPAITGEYFYLGANKLKSNIGIQALKRGQDCYHAILDAGANWYEIDKTEDFILENGKDIDLLITPVTGGSVVKYPIVLEGLPNRPERTSRIRMHLIMDSPKELQLTITDLGFGEIYPKSDYVYEKEITI